MVVVSTRFLLLLIRSYQILISPLPGPNCRFTPSWSQYAIEAIQSHGPWCGCWLALRRLGRCHPLHPGGTTQYRLLPSAKTAPGRTALTLTHRHRHRPEPPAPLGITRRQVPAVPAPGQ
ncbi:MAG: membrane protein insertion efficiency factor YidD [Cyanobium sp. PLM2.Bin73]|nr:MAG: membrane protein insertion efficiency factor YidD [Cyanobium sp. PLM2.Bin73]